MNVGWHFTMTQYLLLHTLTWNIILSTYLLFFYFLYKKKQNIIWLTNVGTNTVFEGMWCLRNYSNRSMSSFRAPWRLVQDITKAEEPVRFHTFIYIHSFYIYFKNTNSEAKSNTLMTVPALGECSELRLLDLSGNQIESLHGHLFRGLGKVHDLMLSHNQIHSISEDAFSGLVRLQSL